jgi:hypothetical protein
VPPGEIFGPAPLTLASRSHSSVTIYFDIHLYLYLAVPLPPSDEVVDASYFAKVGLTVQELSAVGADPLRRTRLGGPGFRLLPIFQLRRFAEIF